MIWKTILFVLFLSFLIYSCSEEESKYYRCSYIKENYWSLLAQFSQSKRLPQLVIKLERSVQNKPLCIEAYLMRADIYFSLDSMKLALNDYKKVATIDTNNVYAFYKCGAVHFLLDEYDSAIHYYNLTKLKIEKGGAFAISKTSEFERLQGRKSLDIDYNRVIYGRGVANRYAGKLNEAIRDLSHCIQNNYMLPYAYFQRGLVYLDAKNYLGQACKDLQQAKLLGNTSADEFLNKHCLK